jgi:hypothetical protein
MLLEANLPAVGGLGEPQTLLMDHRRETCPIRQQLKKCYLGNLHRITILDSFINIIASLHSQTGDKHKQHR